MTIKKSTRPINKIILHCSATEEGKHFSTEQIRQWHKQGNGWKDIGYHYVIELDGSIHEGRDVNMIGSHTANHNAQSIGVCYVGGVDVSGRPKDTRTHNQRIALLELIHELKEIYPNADICGHYQFANKACPSFKIEDFTKEYKQYFTTHKCIIK